MAPPEPKTLGIQVVEDTLGLLIQEPNNLERFFQTSFEFAMQEDFLGTCSNHLEKLSYTYITLGSHDSSHRHTMKVEMDALADMHDYLVDSAKNGYVLTPDRWTERLAKVKHIKLKEPAYKDAPERVLSLDDPKRPSWSSTHITDYLVYDVARSHARRIINDAEASLLTPPSPERDHDLSLIHI